MATGAGQGKTVQLAFVAILVLALLAVMVSFGVMGLRDHTRSCRLERYSHERGMHFASVDPFDIPERFGDFALFSCGHTPRASNVTHGQIGGWAVRAFDFRYEVGHGARRMTCRYGVVILDLPRDSSPMGGAALPRTGPEVLMWNQGDVQHAPLTVRLMDERVGYWSVCGSVPLAEALQSEADALAAVGLSLQVYKGSLMLCVPVTSRRSPDYTVWMDAAGGLAERIRRVEADPPVGLKDRRT